MISINGKLSQVGNFEIKIRLKDDFDRITETSFKFSVAKGFEGVKMITESGNSTEIRELTAKINSIS